MRSTVGTTYGVASTVYDVAVGGTDFGDYYTGTTASYWSTANSTNFGSALGYVPEIAWNDTCASTLISNFFGFATLNILSLASRRLEPNRRGMSFGELMAVLVVLLSVFLLGWEMLNLFHIFPIKLQR